jgi:hypothetical protein
MMTSGRGSGAVPAILWGGLIAGVLDISSAFVIWISRGVGPVRGLQGIASALLGKRAFDGGLPTALLGLACHFLIAYTATAGFYIASRRLRILTRQAVPAGLAYGIAVYLVMYHIVMPLFSLHPRHTVSNVVSAVLIHMFLVGFPIALSVRRFAGSISG